MLGCLFGYVSGGVLGRVLDRALGVVERRVDRHSARGRSSPARSARSSAARSPLVLVVPLALLVPRAGRASLDRRLASWVVGYVGYPHRRRARATRCSRCSACRPGRSCARRRSTRATVCSSTRRWSWTASCSPLARGGVLGGDLMVARFVLDEVQGFADAPDDVKRRRARRGLETLECLQREGTVRVFVLDDEVPEHAEVDAKLIALARRLQLRLLTNDGPLARNAELQGVPTCNLRRLAQELTPDDRARRLRARGAHARRQGSGAGRRPSRRRLDGRRQRRRELVGGPEVQLQVTSVVPTAAGRMVFARLDRRSPAAAILWRACEYLGHRRRRPGRHALRRGEAVRAPRRRDGRSTARSGRAASRATASSSCCRPTRVAPRPPVCGVAVGGATRSDSVRAGLARVPDDADIVVVHDAARPLASRVLFARVIDAVRAGADAAVPGCPSPTR